MKKIRLSLLLIGLLSAANLRAAVTLEWVTVGDAGNAADSTGYGAVGNDYRIMKYEVTNSQYAEFLNNADATGINPNAIYSASMSSDARGGITFTSGNAAGSKYAVKSGYGNMPVVFVSHLDAQRFANWIHNGQGSGSTETGAYTVSEMALHSGLASVWIPTEDEWYKAAYYQPTSAGGDSDSYWLYPTRSNTQPTSATAPSTILGAVNYNYNDARANGINGGYAATQSTSFVNGTNYLSNVGAYSNSSSYYGTFDQGGNVFEWNDAVIGSVRGQSGGSWYGTGFNLRASNRFGITPASETDTIGFRLASSIPEPTRGVLTLGAMCGLLLRRRRLPFVL
jgi:formylglycine-generating enzyme required for sulfatase activity